MFIAFDNNWELTITMNMEELEHIGLLPQPRKASNHHANLPLEMYSFTL